MLQKTWETLSGLTVVNAIHQVLNAQMQANGEAAFQIAVFADATNKTAVEIYGHNFTSNPAQGDLISQCYAHVLTLADYAGAIEV